MAASLAGPAATCCYDPWRRMWLSWTCLERHSHGWSVRGRRPASVVTCHRVGLAAIEVDRPARGGTWPGNEEPGCCRLWERCGDQHFARVRGLRP